MQLGDILLGTSDEVLITWWGPDPIPEGHILMESVNSIVCQPSEDNTCISNMNCTGWIRHGSDNGTDHVETGHGEGADTMEACCDNGTGHVETGHGEGADAMEAGSDNGAGHVENSHGEGAGGTVRKRGWKNSKGGTKKRRKAAKPIVDTQGLLNDLTEVQKLANKRLGIRTRSSRGQ